MKLSHTLRATQVAFDDPNLVSSAGLVPTMALAEAAGLRDLADARLSVPSDKGANPGLKVASLVAGMVAGADSIDDMALLRHGGMGRVFTNAYAPSTLGSFLRAFTFGHVRQLDAVATRFLAGLAGRAPLLPIPAVPSRTVADWAVLDVDDTVVVWRRTDTELRCMAAIRPVRADSRHPNSTVRLSVWMACGRDSGLTQAESATAVGTSASRLGACRSGPFLPSAATSTARTVQVSLDRRLDSADPPPRSPGPGASRSVSRGVPPRAPARFAGS